ncbi:peroxiredoxin [Vibrio sp.]|uniref:peroxiredoxin n=1 Tax=Vibrio sp. TaxID=678 RepID=UPI00311F48AE
MKPIVLFLLMINTSLAHAQYEVTHESAGLGDSQKVTLERTTTLHLEGEMLKSGDLIPAMALKTPSLDSVNTQGSGKVRVFNVLVSVDTPVCVEQAKAFEKLANQHKNEDIEFVTVSADTPFALNRFVTQHDLGQNGIFLSDSIDHQFGLKTGVQIKELGLLSRAILVIDENDKIIHIQRVPELTTLPDLDKAVEVAKRQL